MKYNLIKKILLCVYCGFMLSLNAQKSQKISLQNAISLALENKAEAIKSELEIQKANYEIAQARANALPNISASGGVTYSIVQQETVLPGEFFGAPGRKIRLAFGQKWNANASATATQMIFNQAVFTGLRAAKTTREFYVINQQLTQEQIIEKVATAYYQVFKMKQVLENVQTNLNFASKTFEIMKGLHDSGLAKQIDLDRMEVRLNNITSAETQAVNALHLSENVLKFLIGLPIETPVELSENTFSIDYEKAFEKNISSADNRTEIKLLEKQKELLILNKKAQQANFFPTLMAVGTYGYLGQGGKNPLLYGEKDGVYWSDFSSVGLNVKIPIFSGLGNRAKVKKADIQIQSIQAEINDKRLAMDLAHQNAKNQLINSLLEIQNQEQNVKLSEKVWKNTQENYSLGLATLTDFIDAERSVSEAKNNYTNALLNYKLAEIELLKSEGNLRKLQE